MRLIIFIVFIIISGELNASEPVDFNPKLLSKVLKRQFDFTDFKLQEIIQSGNTFITSDNQGKYFKFQSSYDSTDILYVYIGRVLSCRTGGCQNPTYNPFITESEYFDYFIIFNSEKTVEAVRVYNYQATHGQEVTASGWLKQFAGYDGKESLIVGREIDAISGATISADAITMDLQIKSRIIKTL